VILVSLALGSENAPLCLGLHWFLALLDFPVSGERNTKSLLIRYAAFIPTAYFVSGQFKGIILHSCFRKFGWKNIIYWLGGCSGSHQRGEFYQAALVIALLGHAVIILGEILGGMFLQNLSASLAFDTKARPEFASAFVKSNLAVLFMLLIQLVLSKI
jgi:hypothetical protein